MFCVCQFDVRLLFLALNDSLAWVLHTCFMPDDRVSLLVGMAEALTSHPLKLSKIQMRAVAEGLGW